MEPKTHLGIDASLCGVPVSLSENAARVSLVTTARMAVDDRGLVHGGFVFGAADYAAMLAVNDPFVVLGAAEVRFLTPVRVGERVDAEARVEADEGKKRLVRASARVGDVTVLEAVLTCFVLARHVLDGKGAR
jgi:acyl-coenzyme A thioesterase PaaI-like protein